MRNQQKIRLAIFRKLSPVVVGAIISKVAGLSWTTIGLIILLLVVGVSVAPSRWLAGMLRALTGDAQDEAARRVRVKDALGGHRRDGRALLATNHLHTEKEFRGMAWRWATDTDTTIQQSYGLTEAENFYRPDKDPRLGTEAFVEARIERLGELIARDMIPLVRRDSALTD